MTTITSVVTSRHPAASEQQPRRAAIDLTLSAASLTYFSDHMKRACAAGIKSQVLDREDVEDLDCEAMIAAPALALVAIAHASEARPQEIATWMRTLDLPSAVCATANADKLTKLERLLAGNLESDHIDRDLSKLASRINSLATDISRQAWFKTSVDKVFKQAIADLDRITTHAAPQAPTPLATAPAGLTARASAPPWALAASAPAPATGPARGRPAEVPFMPEDIEQDLFGLHDTPEQQALMGLYESIFAYWTEEHLFQGRRPTLEAATTVALMRIARDRVVSRDGRQGINLANGKHLVAPGASAGASGTLVCPVEINALFGDIVANGAQLEAMQGREWAAMKDLVTGKTSRSPFAKVNRMADILQRLARTLVSQPLYANAALNALDILCP